jgi:hypothetical protein
MSHYDCHVHDSVPHYDCHVHDFMSHYDCYVHDFVSHYYCHVHDFMPHAYSTTTHYAQLHQNDASGTHERICENTGAIE